MRLPITAQVSEARVDLALKMKLLWYLEVSNTAYKTCSYMLWLLSKLILWRNHRVYRHVYSVHDVTNKTLILLVSLKTGTEHATLEIGLETRLYT